MTSNEISGVRQPFHANRIADEKIYDNLDFYDYPKEYFSLILKNIEHELSRPNSILDIGCANGSFLHHAGEAFAGAKLSGLEPVGTLAARARNNLKDAKIIHGGLFDDDLEIDASDVVTMMSVIGIFDDPEKVVRRLLDLTSNHGNLFIFSPFNEEPIDVILSYRRAPAGEWETGHNLFSKETMTGICELLGVGHNWVDFTLGQAIPRTEDPMRSWTEHFRGDEHQIIYGTNMFVTPKLLIVSKWD